MISVLIAELVSISRCGSVHFDGSLNQKLLIKWSSLQNFLLIMRSGSLNLDILYL